MGWVLGLLILIAATCPVFGADMDIVVEALKWTESSYNPKAVSPKGAIGLMQILPSAWEKELKEVGIIKHRNDLFHAKINEKAGRYILAKLSKQYKGNLDKVLHHYVGRDAKIVNKVKRKIRQLEEIEK